MNWDRLKSRAEYKHVFSSVSTFYRALHIMSTSRYRLPIRRHIFDLFDIELDSDVVKQLSEYSKSLVLAPTKTAPTSRRRAVSVLFAAPRTHTAGSDGEDEPAQVKRANSKATNAVPVVNLRPRDTIIGFAGIKEEN